MGGCGSRGQRRVARRPFFRLKTCSHSAKYLNSFSCGISSLERGHGYSASALIAKLTAAACDGCFAEARWARTIGCLGPLRDIPPNLPRARIACLPLLPAPVCRCSSMLRARLGENLPLICFRKVGASHHHPSGSPNRVNRTVEKFLLVSFVAICVFRFQPTTTRRVQELSRSTPMESGLRTFCCYDSMGDPGRLSATSYRYRVHV